MATWLIMHTADLMTGTKTLTASVLRTNELTIIRKNNNIHKESSINV